MAKIEAGQVDLTMGESDLAGMVRTHQKAFEMRVERRPINGKAFIDARVEGVFFSDELLISQGLTNLLENAKKFTLVGTIGVRINQREKVGDACLLQFQVHNTGVCVAKEDLALIFDKLKQVNLRDRHKIQGTGPGLATVNQLIELTDGEISAESQKNKGTTVTFTLPLKRQNVPGIAAPN